MEMCVDNPREGFEDLFATHPRGRRRASTRWCASPAGTIRGRSPCRNSMPSRRSSNNRTRKSRSLPPRQKDPGGPTVPAASHSCPRVRRSISPHLRPDRPLVAPIPHHGDRRVDRVANGFRLIACLAALAVAGCTAVSDPAGLCDRVAGPLRLHDLQGHHRQPQCADRAHEAVGRRRSRRRKPRPGDLSSALRLTGPSMCRRARWRLPPTGLRA